MSTSTLPDAEIKMETTENTEGQEHLENICCIQNQSSEVGKCCVVCHIFLDSNINFQIL